MPLPTNRLQKKYLGGRVQVSIYRNEDGKIRLMMVHLGDKLSLLWGG